MKILYYLTIIFLAVNLIHLNISVFAQNQISTDSSQLGSLKSQISKQLELRKLKIYAGEVKGVLSNTISIESSSGNATIQVKPETQMKLYASDKQTTISEIDIGDFVIALGAISGQKILKAEDLIVKPDQRPDITRQLVVGFVLSTKDKLIEIYDNDKKQTTNLEVNEPSEIIKDNQATASSQLKRGNLLIAIVKKETDKLVVVKAKIIDTQVIINLPESSPSATVSAR